MEDSFLRDGCTEILVRESDVVSLVWESLVAQMVNNLPAIQEAWVCYLAQVDPLKKGMATQSRILAWENPMDRGVWQAGITESDTTDNFTFISLVPCWWDYTLLQSSLRTVWRFLKKLKTERLYDPGSHSGYISERNEITVLRICVCAKSLQSCVTVTLWTLFWMWLVVLVGWKESDTTEQLNWTNWWH